MKERKDPFVDVEQDKDRSVENLGMRMRMSPHNVNKVHDVDKAVQVNGRVPAIGQPANTDRQENGQKHRHLHHPKHIVDLQSHGLFFGIGVTRPTSILFRVFVLTASTGSTLGKGPFKLPWNQKGLVSMTDTRKENTPDMQQCHDTKCNAIPAMHSEVGVYNVPTIQEVLGNEGFRKEPLDALHASQQEKVVRQDTVSSGRSGKYIVERHGPWARLESIHLVTSGTSGSNLKGLTRPHIPVESIEDHNETKGVVNDANEPFVRNQRSCAAGRFGNILLVAARIVGGDFLVGGHIKEGGFPVGAGIAGRVGRLDAVHVLFRMRFAGGGIFLRVTFFDLGCVLSLLLFIGWQQ